MLVENVVLSLPNEIYAEKEHIKFSPILCPQSIVRILNLVIEKMQNHLLPELKENIVDANSQLNDIKALKIRSYNFKESTGYNTHKQIGVVAQELEASGMNGLIKEIDDIKYVEGEELPEGKNIGDVKEKGYKTVAYSVLYMKAIKALQEAIVKIETLEAKVSALEG